MSEKVLRFQVGNTENLSFRWYHTLHILSLESCVFSLTDSSLVPRPGNEAKLTPKGMINNCDIV